jgi:tRNA-dihydrouridine synthase C
MASRQSPPEVPDCIASVPMTLLLAPMEGLLDFSLRDLLTRVGGVDRCVAEFIRVTNTLLPERVFFRTIPELHQGSRTPAGVPVRAQLLGSDPVCLAENADRLAGLGPAGIDLNFGCPTKVVNRHGGGAALLVDPDKLLAIVSAVRRAVPAAMPVSAKMRLGFKDDEQALDCARALVAGGAEELVVHGRTQAQGYRPPAHWDRIAQVREAVQAVSISVPVIANGEIWTVADARRCRIESGCDALMLGRGIVADPGLALAIRSNLHDDDTAPGLAWPEIERLLIVFWALTREHFEPRQRAGRLKQWLHLLANRHPQAEEAYLRLRVVNDSRLLDEWVAGLRPALFDGMNGNAVGSIDR